MQFRRSDTRMEDGGVTINSGIDLSNVDSAARPQDDLFGHVNGRWLAEYEMPADRATDGAFRTLFDRAEEQVRDLITDAASSNPRRPSPLRASAHRRTPTSSASATSTRASWTKRPSRASGSRRCTRNWP